MSQFRKVEPLTTDGLQARSDPANALAYIEWFQEGQSIPIEYKEAIALQDWLASATGHYPKKHQRIRQPYVNCESVTDSKPWNYKGQKS